MIILNDPYEAGGMHLPDIFMFMPVFVERHLLGYAVLVAHYNDMGGRVPGSSAADSTEIYQEGLRIPVVKLIAGGVRNEAVFRMIAINVRVPDVVLGDLDAQLAACRIGERGDARARRALRRRRARAVLRGPPRLQRAGGPAPPSSRFRTGRTGSPTTSTTTGWSSTSRSRSG